MEPASPVSTANHGQREIVFAKDQPEYLPLPAIIDEYGHRITTRWKLTWRERLRVLVSGSIWHSCLTFGMSLQPIMLYASDPYEPQ